MTKSKVICFLALGIAVVFSATAALAQLTVDATGPVRERHRNPTSGRGGSASRRLPLEVAIRVHDRSNDIKEKIDVEFILTNVGETSLTLPISPNPGDLEPKDPSATYTVLYLNVFLTSDQGPKGGRQSTVLSGGAGLYGQPVFPQTLATLAPGESLKVMTQVAVPPAPTAMGARRAVVLVGHAWLYEQTLTPVDNQLTLENKEVGSASSVDYAPSSIFKSTD